MFEQKILFDKLFSRSKIVGAIKDKVEGHFLLFFAVLKWRCQFIQRPEQPFNYLNF